LDRRMVHRRKRFYEGLSDCGFLAIIIHEAWDVEDELRKKEILR